MKSFPRKRRRRVVRRDWTVRQNTYALSTRWGMFVGVMATMLLCLVFMRQSSASLNDRIRMEEARAAELTAAVKTENGLWAQITSPRNLDIALARHALALKHPLRRQVIVLASLGGGVGGEPDVVAYAMNR